MSQPTTAVLDIEKIEVEDGLNPRTRFDEASLAELEASIRQDGLVTALTVVPAQGDRYTVIAGERRLIAAKRAGLKQAPAVIRPVKGSRAATLVENLIREDLDPIDAAQGLADLAEAENLTTHQQIADRIGKKKSASWVSQHLRLLNLPEAVQTYIDDFRREKLSSSRIRSIINAVRSLYRWALYREKATRNPAESIQLPANDSKERDRIATPGEFAYLLDQLEPVDALPWALAGYGTARSQEIRALEWPEVDFEHDVMLLADSDKARKSEAARRIVPIVMPLRQRLYAEWIRQGRPTTGRVCPPRRESLSGMISLDQLQKRIVETWEDLDLRPIGLQDSRHTAATWLDHAGVSPKVASVFMGHKAPKRQPDAAPITLRRYTHILPGELERARDQLDVFLAERAAEEAGESFKLAVAA